MSATVTDLSREFVVPEAAAQGAEDDHPADGARPLLSMSAMVRGGEVELRNAIVGGVAGEKIELERGMLRTAFASGEVKIHQGAARLVVAGGDVSIVQGGAQAIASNGSVRLEKAGAGFILARDVDLANGSTVVFGVTRRLEVKDGGRVIFGPRTTFVIAGAVTTLIAAIATLRFRRRRT